MRKPLLGVAAAMAVACVLSAGFQAGAQDYNVISLYAVDLDSLYPGTCSGDAGCFPSLIGYYDPDEDDSSFTLGFTGSETHVAWEGVCFPANPLGMVFKYATPHPALNLDFYEDGITGTYFWFVELPSNVDSGYYPMQWSDTTWIDYSLFSVVPDLSGIHDIFMQTSCGGPGCGNFYRFDFIFNPEDTLPCTPVVSRRSLDGRGVGSHNLPAVKLATPGSRMPGMAEESSYLYYDLRGRRMRRMPNVADGLVIVKPMQR